MHPDLDLFDIDPELLPIITVTDCKSLYDTMHKEGNPKAPTERRLEVDLAALRQMYNLETQDSDILKAGSVPILWTPTQRMLAERGTCRARVPDAG